MNTTSTKLNSSFNPIAEVKKASRNSEANLLYLLDVIIHFMMAQECLDLIKRDKTYLRFRLKKLTSELSNEIEPILKRDYSIVFKNGEETTLNIISEFEILVRYIALNKVPPKESLQDMVKAYNLKCKAVGSITKKVIKSDDREANELSKKETDFLHLLDYIVNLLFLYKYLGMLTESQYNCTLLKKKINLIIEEVRPILKRDFNTVFKVGDGSDLIYNYKDFIGFLGSTKIDQKIVVAQLVESWNINPEAMKGITQKTLKQ